MLAPWERRVFPLAGLGRNCTLSDLWFLLSYLMLLQAVLIVLLTHLRSVDFGAFASTIIVASVCV